MTTIPTTRPRTPPPPRPHGRGAGARIAPLENGDRMSGAEFDRRCAGHPDLERVELIEGVVYMPPPLFEETHGAPHSDVVTWLGVYRSATPGLVVSDNSSMRHDRNNRPQPDAYLRILETHGGRS